MMGRKTSIQTAHNLMSLLWPDFKEIDGMVFLAWEQITISSLDRWDHIYLESLFNHTHMIDFFTHHINRTPTEENDLVFNYEHPDFKLLCNLGKQIARLWFLKLTQDFPMYRFRVYYTQYDNPIVRFHRVRDDEYNWLDEKDWVEEIKNKEIIIYDTGEKLI